MKLQELTKETKLLKKEQKALETEIMFQKIRVFTGNPTLSLNSPFEDIAWVCEMALRAGNQGNDEILTYLTDHNNSHFNCNLIYSYRELGELHFPPNTLKSLGHFLIFFKEVQEKDRTISCCIEMADKKQQFSWMFKVSPDKVMLCINKTVNLGKELDDKIMQLTGTEFTVDEMEGIFQELRAIALTSFDNKKAKLLGPREEGWMENGKLGISY